MHDVRIESYCCGELLNPLACLHEVPQIRDIAFFRFDGRRFNAVAAPQPNAISIDDANNVWIATARGVFRSTAKQPFAAIAGWPNEEATAVWFDKASHATWAASTNRIGRFANAAWTFWTNPANERIDEHVHAGMQAPEQLGPEFLVPRGGLHAIEQRRFGRHDVFFPRRPLR